MSKNTDIPAPHHAYVAHVRLEEFGITHDGAPLKEVKLRALTYGETRALSQFSDDETELGNQMLIKMICQPQVTQAELDEWPLVGVMQLQEAVKFLQKGVSEDNVGKKSFYGT